MNANELRIGNLVYANRMINNEVVVINTIGYNPENKEYLLSTSHFPYLTLSQCEPITLTEEWLVKLGADISWMSGSVLVQFKINNKLRFVRSYSQDLIGNIELDLRHDTFSLNTKKIKYVHQLQNIYFALTGEELK